MARTQCDVRHQFLENPEYIPIASVKEAKSLFSEFEPLN